MYRCVLYIWDKFVLFLNIFRKKIKASECGHLTHKFIEVKVYGERAIYDRTHGEEVDYCEDCLASLAIHCAKCYGVIFVGSRVQSFILNEGDIPIQRLGHVERCGGGGYVCCTSMECAGGLIAGGSGRWVAPGVYKKVTIKE